MRGTVAGKEEGVGDLGDVEQRDAEADVDDDLVGQLAVELGRDLVLEALVKGVWQPPEDCLQLGNNKHCLIKCLGQSNGPITVCVIIKKDSGTQKKD